MNFEYFAINFTAFNNLKVLNKISKIIKNVAVAM